MSAEKLNMVLFEKQTDAHTPEYTLGANDFIDVIEGAKADITPDAEADARGSTAFDNYPPTIGRTTVEISLMFSLYSLGSADPDLVRCMECAGWRRDLDEPYIVLSPTSEIVNAGSLHAYRGGPGASKSLLEKFGNVMFDGSLKLETGKRATVSLTGKGKYIAPPVIATMPAIDSNRERETAPAIKAATVSIMGQAYNFTTIEFTFGQNVENASDPTDTYAGGETEITERKIDFSATLYMKPTTPLIPHADIYAGTQAAINIAWGTTHCAPGGSDLEINAPTCVLTDVKKGNSNGIDTWEVKGTVVKNDLKIKIYNGNTSSLSISSDSMSSDSNSSVSDSSESTSSSSISV